MRFEFRRLLFLLTVFLAPLFHFHSYSQETGFLIFSGKTKFSNTVKRQDEIVPNVKIEITKESTGEAVKNYMSDKKGKFEFNLPFGIDYRITFTLADAEPAYIIVYASQVPKEMYEILPPGYETEVILKSTKDKGINKYKCPYEKVLFVKKRKGFVTDEEYRDKFQTGTVFCDELVAKKEPVITNTVQPSVEEKKISVGGKFLAGENPSLPIVNTVVYLVNSENKVIETTTTNLLGAFVFTGFIYEKDNVLRVIASDVGIAGGKKIIFIGKDGKEIQTTRANEKGGFEFRILTGDKNTLALMEMEDSKLKRDLIGKLLAEGKPVANSKLNLKNDKGDMVQSTLTDVNGKFIFTDVAAQQVIVIAIDPGADIKTGSKVVIADEQGKPQKELIYKPGENFEFKMLPHEQKEMSRFYADDPWLKVINLKGGSVANDNITITENVYFNAGESVLLADAQKVLDKVIVIMQQVPDVKMELGAHTDSRGSDDSNLQLSKKRAEAAVAYMVSKKIDSKRLKAIGYGETQPVNKCKNNVECSDEEHAQNRRIEFKVVK